MNKIIDAIDYLANIPNINLGGCLVVAYSIFLLCEKNNIKDIQIVALNDFPHRNRHNSNRYFLIDSSHNVKIPRHFGWKFSSPQIYDTIGDGEIDYELYIYRLPIPIEVTKFYCKKLLQIDEWNETFNRKLWIPRIEKDLEINLGE